MYRPAEKILGRAWKKKLKSQSNTSKRGEGGTEREGEGEGGRERERQRGTGRERGERGCGPQKQQ